MTLFDTTELRRPTQRKLHAAWWEIAGEKMYLIATTATELAPLAAAPTSGPNGLSAAEDERRGQNPEELHATRIPTHGADPTGPPCS